MRDRLLSGSTCQPRTASSLLHVSLANLLLALAIAPSRHHMARAEEAKPQPEFKGACDYFASGRRNIGDPWNWGPHHICDTSVLGRWLEAAAGNCHDCAKRRSVCGVHAPTLHVHLYFRAWPKHWKFVMYVFKALLMTQNLQRTRAILWVDDARIVKDHPAAAFFDTYSKYIAVREVPPWTDLVHGTPLQGGEFWANHTAVKTNIYSAAGYADVLRLLLLHKFGGLWLDTDVMLLQDVYPVTVQIGYQFFMRWTNNHILYLKRSTPLTQRILEMVANMPYTNETTAKGYVENICKPKGYMTAHGKYGYTDIYNMCVLKIIHEVDNKRDDPDDILFTQPLGWYDTDWPGCHDSRKGGNGTAVDHVLRTFMGLHTRLIDNPTFEPGSALAAATALADDFFSLCQDPSCLPLQGMHLSTYVDVVAQMRAHRDAGRSWRRRLRSG